MDANNNYHWGATPEIMKIIRRKDNSPETKKLVERRIEIVKPGTMRIKRDSHGGEHWTPRRPDANGRREVVEIDLPANGPKQEKTGYRQYGSHIVQ